MRKYSIQEMMKREYHKRLRLFKAWCKTYSFECYSFKDAPPKSICAISYIEFDVEMLREDIEEDNECWFLNPLDYEIYSALLLEKDE